MPKSTELRSKLRLSYEIKKWLQYKERRRSLLVLHGVLKLDALSFISTNIGILAVRRHPYAELLYYSQVWRRTVKGEWQKHHLFSRDDDSEYTSGMLEALYRHTDPQTIQYEDGW